MAVNINSTALVEFKYPDEVQRSNDPIHGSYYIECYNLQGQFANTDDLWYGVDADTVYWALVSACPWLRDKIDVVDDSKIYWKEDGIDWKIYFNRMEGELP